MRKMVLLLILVTLFGIYPSIYAQGELNIDVALDRDTIGMDEQAILQIVVSGDSQNLPTPHMPTFSMFDIETRGRSSNFSYNNGVVETSITYHYLLIPKRSGTFPIDQISAVYNNKRYKGNKLFLTVLKDGSTVSDKLSKRAVNVTGKSKDYFLEAIVDNKNPFVNEQITLTLKFYIAVKYYGSPELSEPTTTGFWKEILGNKTPYNQKINNRQYKIIERKYALFPTQTGELEIGRAMIRVTVPSKRQARRNSNLFGGLFGAGEEVSVRSNLVKLKVKPLPKKGRPDDFSGTIGGFVISASVNKKEVEANQPISVTIRISGRGNIKSVAEPKMPDLENQFRIYRASTSENLSKTGDKIGGTKIFEEVFIPKRPGDVVIPAIHYNYFDPVAKRYKHISTKPIKLKVTKPEGFIASGDVPYANPDLKISSDARDIRYIKDNIGDTQPVGQLILSSPIYIVVNAIPLLIFAGMIAVRIRREKFAGDIGLARSKAALREAKRRLTKAKSIAHTESTGEFYVEVYAAVTSFIADKMNISPHGLTIDRIKVLLAEKNAETDLINDIEALLKHSDFARYASSSMTQDDINSDLDKAQNIMVSMSGVSFE